MVLEHLARRHEVDLLTRVFPEDEPNVEEARRLARNIHPIREGSSASPNAGSVPVKIMSYRRLGREAGRIVRQGSYDLVLVEYTEAGIFLDVRGWPPAVLDCHDIITKPWYRKWRSASGVSRILWGLVYLALSTGERRTAKKFRVLFARSREDAEWARNRIGHRDVRVLPHPAGADLRLSPREEVPGRLLFLGAMGRRLNVDAALYFHRKVFPLVKDRFPAAQFWIVGGNPPKDLCGLEAADPSVRVTGFVGDIGECYRQASVFVAPILIGGGIIVKILDAMAAGVPVVTTTYGNEGIRAREGEELYVADTPEEFALRTISLLGDELLRRRMGDKGREFAMKNYGKERIMEDLEANLLDIANSFRRS
jgi:glycosyltransferase involved in cell wall biosynthesis